MAKPKTLTQRIKADPKLRAKYLSNPGLRSKLPSSMLTPAQRRQRDANTAAAKPVTPGSPLTQRDLGREAKAAADVRYGPQERALAADRARAVQAGTDMGGFYDQYKAELAKHVQGVNQINATAAASLQGNAASLRALDQGDLTATQQAANASAAIRGATAKDLTPDASNASLVRQQALAGFANQQAMTGAATSRYATDRANVIAPTQQLQARAQSARGVRDIGEKITGVAADRGAFDLNYRAGRTSDEAKNVLAQQALGVNVQKAQLASEDKRKARVTSNRNADASRQQAAAATAERERIARARLKIAQGKAGKGGQTPAERLRNDKVITTIRTAADDVLRNRDKRRPVRDPVTGQPLPGPMKDGVPEIDPKTGQPKPGPTYIADSAENRSELRKKYKDKDIANAAMDLAFRGYISAENVRRLRKRTPPIIVPRELTRPGGGSMTLSRPTASRPG